MLLLYHENDENSVFRNPSSTARDLTSKEILPSYGALFTLYTFTNPRDG